MAGLPAVNMWEARRVAAEVGPEPPPNTLRKRLAGREVRRRRAALLGLDFRAEGWRPRRSPAILAARLRPRPATAIRRPRPATHPRTRDHRDEGRQVPKPPPPRPRGGDPHRIPGIRPIWRRRPYTPKCTIRMRRLDCYIAGVSRAGTTPLTSVQTAPCARPPRSMRRAIVPGDQGRIVSLMPDVADRAAISSVWVSRRS